MQPCKAILKRAKGAAGFPLNLYARIRSYKRKNISPAQIPMLIAHRKVLAQNMRNFTELYGSPWKALLKMNQITGGSIKYPV